MTHNGVMSELVNVQRKPHVLGASVIQTIIGHGFPPCGQRARPSYREVKMVRGLAFVVSSLNWEGSCDSLNQ
jgi:hypothetical protein